MSSTPMRASGVSGDEGAACGEVFGDSLGEASARSAACVTHRLDEVTDLEFSHEEALECCTWMTPDFFAGLAHRRELAAEDAVEAQAHSTDAGSCAESEPGEDWGLEAAWYAYDEAPPSELSCLVSLLNGLPDGKVKRDGFGEVEAPASVEFSHEEALECCTWMTPDLFARLTHRRELAADEADGGSSCVESGPGDDRTWCAYDEAPPSELSCLVYRLSGLEVQDDGLGAEEAHQPLPTPASVPELLGRRPPPGFGALCASSCEELYAKYSLRP